MKRKLTARCPIRFGQTRFNGGKAAVEGFVHQPSVKLPRQASFIVLISALMRALG
ncbi:hypothetical protein X742_06895 [Mesorhizobium sp. LNHC232B00]|nr:hypothetical protein X742_06895 [Mesorhizobium sp. LNHC232B00]